MDDDDAIAIVGVGCRFPGADDLDEFWRVLLNGENHVVDIPPDRWNNAAFYDTDRTKHAKLYTTKAGFVKSYKDWDNRLFGVSDVEASRMDPQQTFVLDCVHMAMEDGGITRAKLSNSQTGVYIGCMNSDFRELAGRDHLEDGSYDVTGTATSIVAARVSYTYNLLGPCMCIDTACSSALMAIHVAMQAIRAGDCEQAICGGVNFLLLPDMFMSLCKAGMMSEVSQCQAFSDRADGYARGEGCGVVIIKPLKQAVADGNKVWATIVTGSNQDGQMARPITAPSGSQQGKLLQKVYRDSSIDPAEVQYIEAHGTGTPVGDPIEANCLGEFFSEHRQRWKTRNKPLPIGSVKSNIGHLESAAGAAGLIKVLLMMKHGTIVPSLHIDKTKPNINPKIELRQNNLQVPLEPTKWDANENNERVACVNSFGFGGSNSHAVVRQLVQENGKQKSNDSSVESCYIICLSAVDRTSLKQSIEYIEQTFQSSGVSLKGLAYTSCCRRDHYSYRIAIKAENNTELNQQCQKKARMINEIKPVTKKRVIFVFCGVGTTWRGMCQELMRSTPAFRESIRRVDVHLQPLTGWKIEQKFTADTQYLDPFVNHIAIFACQVGLTDMWRHYGVLPDAIVGQSVGEVAAAYASGVLPLKEAVKVIYHRSKALAAATGGKMLVVGNIDIDVVDEMCKATQGVSIAVYSSPISCAISGDSKAVDEISNELQKNAAESGTQILLRDIPVKCAYHSHHVESSMSTIEQSLSSLGKETPCTEHISSVTGKTAASNDFVTGAYWAANVRRPVLFMQAIKTAADPQGRNLFVEIGPKQVLKAQLPGIFGRSEDIAYPSMNAGNELSCMQSTLAKLYEEGLDIKWERFYTYRAECAKLPKYQFHRRHTLHISDKISRYLEGSSTNDENFHLFVAEADSKNAEFKLMVSQKHTAFVFDHFHLGEVLVPGATYAEVGFAIARRLLSWPEFSVDVSLSFRSTLSLSTGTEYQAAIYVEQTKNSGSLRFTVRKDDRIFAEGTVTQRTTTERDRIDIEQIKKRCSQIRTKRENYSCLERIGFTYGEAMSVLGNSWACGEERLAEIVLPTSVMDELSRTTLHPAILDGVLQVAGTFIDNETPGTVLPQGIGHVAMNRPPTSHMFAYVNRICRTLDEDHLNAVLLTETGQVIGELEDFHTKIIQDQQINDSEKVYQVVWKEVKIDKLKPDVELPHKREESVVVFHLGSKLVHRDNLAKFDSFFIVNLQPQARGADLLIEKALSTVDSKILKCIIFAPGKLEGDLESHTGKHVYERAKTVFSNMVILMKALNHRNITAPLLVVTEDSQIFSTEKPTIYCSELWGMVRSAVREFIHQDITLIDIHTNTKHTDVLRLLSSNVDGVNKYTELVFSEDTFFVSKFIVHPKRNVEPQFRRVRNDNAENCILMSSKCNEVNRPMWHLCHRPGRNRNPGSASELRFEWYCEHKKEFLSVTEESDNLCQDLWPETREDGFAVLAVEGGGRVGGKDKAAFLFCYPVQVSRVISVPDACIIRETELPWYCPGLLKCAVVTWNLAQMVHPEDTVLIVTEYVNCKLGVLLLDALREKVKVKSKLVSKEEMFEQSETIPQQAPCTTLVLLASLDKSEATHVCPLLNSVTSIISIRQCISPSTERYLYQSFNLSMNVVEPENLFKRHSLERQMPAIRGWLTSIDKTSSNAIAEPPHAARQRQNSESALPFSYQENKIHVEAHSNATEMKVTKSDLFRANGCYVLVGGLTGLGWELLVLMAEQGAGVLATLSRRKPDDQQTEKILATETRCHCRIVPIQADITDATALKNGIVRLTAKLNGIPIRGIFHGGGVLADSMLMSMTTEQIDTALRPKILGAWNLHIASKGLPLDFFVLHSSVTAIFGGAGQCNYAAGNSFLDSLAHYRRAQNLCGQSINWGALALGMAARDPVTVKNLERQGVELLDVDDIKKLFLHALMVDDAQVTYGAFKWDVLLAQKRVKFLEKFRDMFRFDPRTDEKMYAIDTAKFKTLGEDEQISMVLTLVKSAVAKVFVIDEELLSSDATLFSLGADSMQLMSFAATLFELTECRLSIASLMAEEATIEFIVDTILQQLSSSSSLSKRKGRQDTETHIQFDRPLTFMQETVLRESQSDLKSFEQLMLIDTDMRGLDLTIEDWKAVFQALVETEPALRTLFAQNGSAILPVAETNLDCCEVPFEDFENEEADQDHRQKYTIDITKECPFKVRVGMTSGVTVLRIIIHKVVADFGSVSMFCQRVQQIAQARKNGTPLPTSDHPVDVYELIESRLQPQMQLMRNYWMNEIPDDLEPLVLRETSESTGSFTVATEEVPADLWKSLVSFTKRSGTTIFPFVVSMYQLLLHKISKQSLFPLAIPADVRMLLPEMRSTINRTINTVPLIADFREKRSVQEFVALTTEKITTGRQNGAYPFQRILTEVKSEQARLNTGRHNVDMLEMITDMSTESHTAKVNTFLFSGTNCDTELTLVLDEKSKGLSLRYGFNSSMVNEHDGAQMIPRLLQLMRLALKKPKRRITDIMSTSFKTQTKTGRTAGELAKANGNSKQSTVCTIV